MAGHPPAGDPAPGDGRLPATALAAAGSRGFGIYVHVPFCAHRCGYCDFNTYTPGELAGSAAPADYLVAVRREVALAARVLGGMAGPASSVFFGGGTPTLLAPRDLGGVLDAIAAEIGLTAGAEVTCEANPETVDAAALAQLRAAGVTRLSLGLQSTAPHVLAALDRRHTPGRALRVARTARGSGFDHVSVDLIYGTAGESAADWRASLEAAVGAGVDHVSAYALVVEEGTRLAREVRGGRVAGPSDDVLAERYELAEEVLTAAGLRWYEISNWARGPGDRCRHNLLYWRGGDWWGLGPGAHSHVGGVRWWNRRHPARYAAALAAGVSPAEGREVLGDRERRMERVMLGLRTPDGVPLGELAAAGLSAARTQVAAGRLDPAAFASGRASLTLSGRLLTDAVTLDLLAG